jgi:hypothetical protein
MKKIVYTLELFAGIVALGSTGCSKKYGCPTNGKNVGAERLMGNEKIPKAKKFKS